MTHLFKSPTFKVCVKSGAIKPWIEWAFLHETTLTLTGATEKFYLRGREYSLILEFPVTNIPTEHAVIISCQGYKNGALYAVARKLDPTKGKKS